MPHGRTIPILIAVLGAAACGTADDPRSVTFPEPPVTVFYQPIAMVPAKEDTFQIIIRDADNVGTWLNPVLGRTDEFQGVLEFYGTSHLANATFDTASRKLTVISNDPSTNAHTFVKAEYDVSGKQIPIKYEYLDPGKTTASVTATFLKGKLGNVVGGD